MGAIQIKNVPEDLHAAIRSRAAAEGKTVSDYVLDLIRRDLEVPTIRAWLAHLATRGATRSTVDTVDLLREIRREREEEIARRIGQPPADRSEDAD